MRIHQDVYEAILLSVNIAPPEMGGILGKKDGIICSFELDYGDATYKACSYSPDVERLNEIIAKWQADEIEFVGIFHTHFFGVSTLSDGDKAYIEKIMRNMPAQVTELLFPLIVLPEKKFVVYKAEFYGEQLSIKEDIIEITGGTNYDE